MLSYVCLLRLLLPAGLTDPDPDAGIGVLTILLACAQVTELAIMHCAGATLAAQQGLHQAYALYTHSRRQVVDKMYPYGG